VGGRPVGIIIGIVNWAKSLALVADLFLL